MGLLPPMVLGLGATPAERDVTVVTVVLQRRCLPLGSRIPPARSSPTSISLSRFTYEPGGPVTCANLGRTWSLELPADGRTPDVPNLRHDHHTLTRSHTCRMSAQGST